MSTAREWLDTAKSRREVHDPRTEWGYAAIAALDDLPVALEMLEAALDHCEYPRSSEFADVISDAMDDVVRDL